MALNYRDEAEKKARQASLDRFTAKSHLRASVVLILVALRELIPAERYRQN